MAVVSDSTTLIILENASRFDLLSNLFTEIYIPQAVWDEIHAKEEFELPPFIRLSPIEKSQELETLLYLLDQGESEAILLAKAKNLPLIIDEKKGRKIATNMGIKIVGLLGILYLNIKHEHMNIEEGRIFLDQVRGNGFRISQGLIDEMFGNLL
jgi:predicted nucleic acid-binding protein